MTGLYRVARNYRAVYRSQPVNFDVDAVVEVDDAQADWVNQDSPGCLIPVDEPPAEPADEPAAEPADEPSGEPHEGIEVEPGETGELVADGDGEGPLAEVVNLDELDRDQLLDYADKHGIEVNRRLGEAKLREAIAEAPLPPVVGHPEGEQA